MTHFSPRHLLTKSVIRLLLAGILPAAVVAALFSTGVVGAAGGSSAPRLSASNASAKLNGHWVGTWTAAPQLTEPANMPPPPFTGTNVVFANSTLRQTLHVSVGGRQIRLRFSNAYGGADLPITMVSVARPVGGQAGVSAIQAGTSRPVTFDGRSAIYIPVGAQMVSDPLDFPVATGTNLTVTIYLSAGQASTSITSHPGSRTNSYMVTGNHVNDQDLPGATSVAHWYFLSGAEISTSGPTAAVAVIGDSLTDGRGSTTNGNDRWTDQLFNRLQSSRVAANVAVLNQGLGGNRVLHDGLGPNVLARLDRDVLAQSGVKWLVVFEGVNDIGTADATDAAQKQVTADLIAAFQQIITRAHALGIRVYGATITPFGGNTMYDDPQGLRAASRAAVNEWIRTSRQFDAVLDFDKAARDPANPGQILPAFDSGDHLHLNPAGYGALAAAVPPGLFTQAGDELGFQ
ncbi:MAG TPA: SGNH/GDSL hydrolase family protein [Streptosporangiaceae bacterium]